MLGFKIAENLNQSIYWDIVSHQKFHTTVSYIDLRTNNALYMLFAYVILILWFLVVLIVFAHCLPRYPIHGCPLMPRLVVALIDVGLKPPLCYVASIIG